MVAIRTEEFAGARHEHVAVADAHKARAFHVFGAVRNQAEVIGGFLGDVPASHSVRGRWRAQFTNLAIGFFRIPF